MISTNHCPAITKFHIVSRNIVSCNTPMVRILPGALFRDHIQSKPWKQWVQNEDCTNIRHSTCTDVLKYLRERESPGRMIVTSSHYAVQICCCELAGKPGAKEPVSGLYINPDHQRKQFKLQFF